jgi:hypothetical protein
MALITFGSAPTKGGSSTVTLDKAELLALPEVAGDAFWSDGDNIKSVDIYFESTVGEQRRRVSFDFTQTIPSAPLELSEKARDNFRIELIALQDFDSDSLLIPRSLFSVSTPSLTALDFVPALPGGADTAGPTVALFNAVQQSDTVLGIFITGVQDTSLPVSASYYRTISLAGNVAAAEAGTFVGAPISPWYVNNGAASQAFTVDPFLVGTTYYYAAVLEDALGNKSLYTSSFVAVEFNAPFVDLLTATQTALDSVSLSVPTVYDETPPVTVDLRIHLEEPTFTSVLESPVVPPSATVTINTTSGSVSDISVSNIASMDGKFTPGVTYWFSAVATDAVGNYGESAFQKVSIVAGDTPFILEGFAQFVDGEMRLGAVWSNSTGEEGSLSIYRSSSQPLSLAEAQLGTQVGATYPMGTGSGNIGTGAFGGSTPLLDLNYITGTSFYTFVASPAGGSGLPNYVVVQANT